MIHTITVLDQAGDYTIAWNAESDDEVALARGQFDDLRHRGYTVFGLTELKEFDPLGGRFEVRMVSAPEVVPAAVPSKRGRRGLGGASGEVAGAFDPKAARSIAVPRMRGGRR